MLHGLRLSRRAMLRASTCGFGYLAFLGMAERARAASQYASPLAVKPPHFPARAKRVVFLGMRGAPSHMDTFDYKPQLNERDGQAGPNKGRKLVGSPWKFQQHGERLWISELFPHLARHADKLCVLNAMHTNVPNHPEAWVMLHTGSFQFVRPSVGAWTLYGLGTENQSLPGFVSISPPVINGGPQNYGSAFLPAIYQGTPLGQLGLPLEKAEVRNLANARLSRDLQRRQLDLIQAMNGDLKSLHPEDAQLDGVIESYELAFRMQTELPEVMDFADETANTLESYGVGEKLPTDDFGRQCLLARRLLEKGVRYVELCHQNWDQHKTLKASLTRNCRETDQPIAALLGDLEQRGLLDETLVVWGGEFGRTPDSGATDGRDHNAKGYSMWLAGGGVKGGIAHGQTDDLGYEAVEGKVHLHDLHATMLHLLGLDHERLTYRYAGRDFRLTDVYGQVVKEILA